MTPGSLATIGGHQGPVIFTTFTPDRTGLATGGLDGVARLASAPDGRPGPRLAGTAPVPAPAGGRVAAEVGR